jgi:hypothetical protein
MKTFIALILFLGIAGTAFANNINEIRLCGSSGNCADISSDGKLQLA